MNSKRMTMNLEDEDRIGPKLKVWWIPQVPGEPFEVELNSFAEAWVLLRALAQYDIFQFKNRIKPDYSYAGGLMISISENDDWTDWYDEDGDDIDKISLHDCIALDRDFYNNTLMQAADEVSGR